MYYDVYESTWLINKLPYKFKAVSFEGCMCYRGN